jgi:hypothetical protein
MDELVLAGKVQVNRALRDVRHLGDPLNRRPLDTEPGDDLAGCIKNFAFAEFLYEVFLGHPTARATGLASQSTERIVSI